jgi:hypothetical protein
MVRKHEAPGHSGERERERTKKRGGHWGVLEQESIGNSGCDAEQQRGFGAGAERAGQQQQICRGSIDGRELVLRRDLIAK